MCSYYPYIYTHGLCSFSHTHTLSEVTNTHSGQLLSQRAALGCKRATTLGGIQTHDTPQSLRSPYVIHSYTIPT